MKKKETFEKLHSKPVSRRDFLATGLIPFSASFLMPSWLQIFAKAGEAQAADLVCRATETMPLCPFISIKLSGGAALAANFLPHNQLLERLPSYSKMGMGKGSALNPIYGFANKAPFYELSGIYSGITAQAKATTLAKSYFVGVPVRSQDDSSNNKFDITGLVSKTGLNGKILANLGRANTDTGVNNQPAYVRPSSPLVVQRFDDVVGALGVSGSLASLTANQKSGLFRTVASLTSAQAANIQKYSGGELLSRLIQCANIDNQNLISNSSSLNIDPLKDPAVAAVWGLTNQTSKATQEYVFATMVYNAANGNAGTVNLEMGGFDYHNGTRSSGDAKDLEAGTVIGRVLETLAVLGKKGFIVVTSDGSVSSADSDNAGTPWMSDRGISGTAYMIAYDPDLIHQVKSFQLGRFTDGQAADDGFVTGGGPEIAAGGIYANYLSFNGAINKLETYLPRVFSNDQIDLIRIIA
ncbi:MAG: hypothetical protein ACXWRZ_13555 [Bdellovibrio sp.]